MNEMNFINQCCKYSQTSHAMNDSAALFTTSAPSSNRKLSTHQIPDYVRDALDIYASCCSLPNQLNFPDQTTLPDYNTMSPVVNPFTPAIIHKSRHGSPQRMYAEKEQTFESLLKQLRTDKNAGQISEDYFIDHEERNIEMIENPYSPLWRNPNQTMKHGTGENYLTKDFNLGWETVDNYIQPILNANTSFHFPSNEQNQIQNFPCALAHEKPHAIGSDKSMQLLSHTTDNSNIKDPTFQPLGISFYNSNNTISNEYYQCRDQEYWCKNPVTDAPDLSNFSSPPTTAKSNPEFNTDKLSKIIKPVPSSHALVHDLHRAISSLSTLPNNVSQLEKVARIETREDSHHHSTDGTYCGEEIRNSKNIQGCQPKQLNSSATIDGKLILDECQSNNEQRTHNYPGQPEIRTYPVPVYMGKNSPRIKSKLPTWKYKLPRFNNCLRVHDSSMKRPNLTYVVGVMDEQQDMIRSEKKRPGLSSRHSSSVT